MYDFRPILSVVDSHVDYSQFDGNGDGYVDEVIFLRSGTGQEDTGFPNDIWSFAMGYPPGFEPGPFDGMYVRGWQTSPEEHPIRSDDCPPVIMGDTLNRIRVICHETAHGVGLPDLYDADAKLDISTYDTPGDDNDHPIVDWCVMGYYGYGLMSLGSDVTTHLCGWSKKYIGWIEPLILDSIVYSDLVIYNIETTRDSSLYLISIDSTEGEYFLLEYRNPRSNSQFDKTDSDFSVYLCPDLSPGCDTLDRGLLITHVHDSLTSFGSINDGTPHYPHYSVAVEDAGYNPSRDAWSNPEAHVTDSAQWWYPYEMRRAAPFNPEVGGQREFGPWTYPSSDGYSAPTGIYVRVDSIVGERLYAYVCNLMQMDTDQDGVSDYSDNCVSSDNPDQEDTDGDSVGDSCDNCLSIPNADQADADSDGAGDSCDNCIDVYNPDQADLNGDEIGDACEYICGDADASGEVDIDDVVYLIAYIFSGGPAPEPYESGDANCAGGVDIDDVVYLIAYIFSSGDAPCDTDVDEVPDC
jgi:M6 family metalloprotease-like protein